MRYLIDEFEPLSFEMPSQESHSSESPPQRFRQAERPPPRPAPRMSSNMISREMFSLRTAGGIVLIGVLIFFIGAILAQSSTIIERPNDYEDYESYYDLVRNMLGFGKILNWLGAMIIALPLYVTGITNSRIDWKVRATMVSTATTIVVATMIVTMFLSFPTAPMYY